MDSKHSRQGDILSIILAAGRSKRFNGLKQLCALKGKSLLEIAVKKSVSSGAEVVVVLGYKWKTIARHISLRRLECLKVVNRKYERGQFSSLRHALTRCNMKKYSGFLIYPVDYAAVRRKSILALLSCFSRDRTHRIFSPSYRGRMGHPVLVSTSILEEFLTLPPEATARDVIYKDMRRIRKINVDDKGIFIDIDTREDYKRINDSGTCT